MALLVVVLIIATFLWLGRVGKRAKRQDQYGKLTAKAKETEASKDRYKRQMDDELIATILPTIRND